VWLGSASVDALAEHDTGPYLDSESLENGVAERWVGSCRRDLLDHVIALDERHLKRLLSQYVSYYHDDRTHLGLDKQTPASRARSREKGTVICQQRVGGLHHRYDWAA